MDKHDFYKFLKKNNLNAVYEIGKYITEKYSLGNAVSLIAEKYDNIQNAYDIIKQNKNIRINCNLTGSIRLNKTFYNGTTMGPFTGYICNWDNHENNIYILDNEDYFYFAATQSNTQNTSKILSVNTCLNFITTNDPREDNDWVVTNAIFKPNGDVITSNNFYVWGRKIEDVTNPLTNIETLSLKQSAFIHLATQLGQILSENPIPSNARLLLFGIKKFNQIHVAYYEINGTVTPLKTIYANLNQGKIKINLNIGFLCEEQITLSKAENYGFVLHPAIVQESIINWLKTISINRPETI